MESKQTRKIGIIDIGNFTESLADEHVQKQIGLRRNKVTGWKYEIVDEQRFILSYIKYEFKFIEIDELDYPR